MRSVGRGAVRAIAVDATSGTILLADAAGIPLTPGLMYDDGRALDQVDRVNDAGAPVWAELGYGRMQPAWALPKLLWLLREHPDLAGGARLMHQADVINRRLVGEDVPTDLGSALKTGAHLLDERWPMDVMAALGVPAGMLPDLVRPGTPIGAVCGSAAEATGIPARTPVVAGTTDGCAAQMGAGALRPGSVNAVLGTTLVLKGVTDDLHRDPSGVVYSHRGPGGRWLPGGASSTGAAVIARDFAGRDLAALTAAAAMHEPAGAIAYPLVSTGERFPFVAPGARGFMLGGDGSEVDRFAAVLQGVAFIERLCFEYLDLLGISTGGDLVFSGGAAANAYWCQLRADILARPVTVARNAEPALGAAILAAAAFGSAAAGGTGPGNGPGPGTGSGSGPGNGSGPGSGSAAAAGSGTHLDEIAGRMVRAGETIEPRPRSAERFADAYARLLHELERRGWLGRALAERALTGSHR